MSSTSSSAWVSFLALSRVHLLHESCVCCTTIKIDRPRRGMLLFDFAVEQTTLRRCGDVDQRSLGRHD
eukprot:scaffold1384_cov256-Pinguiococcus_pyrenoidosus.AAC.5